MSQDINKLLEYKNLKESLPRDKIVLEELMVRNARFCELHDELFPADEDDNIPEEEACNLTIQNTTSNSIYLEADDEYDEDYYEEDDESDWDDDDDDSDYSDDDLSFSPPAPRPTTADVQNRLRDLAKLKSMMPSKPVVNPVASSQPALNNDGRSTCFACGAPTKIVDTGFGKPYCVCTACGK